MQLSLSIPNTFAMHQPHFLPWLPYFAKIASAAHFVVLDNVQYRRYYYQARTRVRVSIRSEETRWLILPVKSSTRLLISDIRLVEGEALKRLKKDLTNTYRRARYFEAAWPTIEKTLSVSYTHLLHVNIALIHAVFSILRISPPPFHLCSELTKSPDRELRIVESGKALRSNLLLVGWGGSTTVHDQDALQTQGITMVHVRPSQMLAGSTYNCNGLTILDTIFLRGARHTANLVKKASHHFQDAVANIGDRFS